MYLDETMLSTAHAHYIHCLYRIMMIGEDVIIYWPIGLLGGVNVDRSKRRRFVEFHF